MAVADQQPDEAQLGGARTVAGPAERDQRVGAPPRLLVGLGDVAPAAREARLCGARRRRAVQRRAQLGRHPLGEPARVDARQQQYHLVTPPGGTVLDPFAGSGATIEAAIIEGFSPIGIELEAEYLPLIQHRIDRQAGDES